MSVLTLRITDQQHQAIKAAARRAGLSMNAFCTEKLMAVVEVEKPELEIEGKE